MKTNIEIKDIQNNIKHRFNTLISTLKLDHCTHKFIHDYLDGIINLSNDILDSERVKTFKMNYVLQEILSNSEGYSREVYTLLRCLNKQNVKYYILLFVNNGLLCIKNTSMYSYSLIQLIKKSFYTMLYIVLEIIKIIYPDMDDIVLLIDENSYSTYHNDHDKLFCHRCLYEQAGFTYDEKHFMTYGFYQDVRSRITRELNIY